MRLPHSKRAIVDLRKLEDYCLNTGHARGRHKARIFRQRLGIDRNDAEWLRTMLLEGIRNNEATELSGNIWGTNWRVDMPVARHGANAVVRSIWIIRFGEEAPRFVTCWVL